jgi:hypothetical protein
VKERKDYQRGRVWKAFIDWAEDLNLDEEDPFMLLPDMAKLVADILGLPLDRVSMRDGRSRRSFYIERENYTSSFGMETFRIEGSFPKNCRRRTHVLFALAHGGKPSTPETVDTWIRYAKGHSDLWASVLVTHLVRNKVEFGSRVKKRPEPKSSFMRAINKLKKDKHV